jgi:hypothetical protein
MHQPPPPPPERKRHRVRNIALGTIGAVAALIVISAVASSSNGTQPSPGATAPQVTQQPAVAGSPSPSPVPPPSPKVLLRMSGNQDQNSAPFPVNSGTLTVHYSYDCSAYGTQGNFIADLITGDEGSASYDDQEIANALGESGRDVTTLYPQDVGSDYHLVVTSECTWTVVVRQDG